MDRWLEIQRKIGDRLALRYGKTVVPSRKYVEDALKHYDAINRDAVLPLTTRELTEMLVDYCAQDINNELNKLQANESPLMVSLDPGYKIVQRVNASVSTYHSTRR